MSHRVKIVCNVIDGLIYLQSHQLCHLDVKPSNILLSVTNGEWNGETLVLSDFGLSASFDNLIGNGGTPGYGSPEQFLGEPSPKSDNYAAGKLGVMTLFPWQSAWNFLAQPLVKGEMSEVEKSPLLKPFHQMISALLNVSLLQLHHSIR